MPQSKWITFLIVAIGAFMSTLDASIVNISLPIIAHQFGVPLGGSIEWVIIAYLVVIAALLLTAGRLADLLGRRQLWAAGLGLFSLGSLACALASSLGALIAARSLQGVGAALRDKPGAGHRRLPGERAGQGAGGGARHQQRPDAGRPDHRLALLALDLRHQRAARRGGRAGDLALPAR